MPESGDRKYFNSPNWPFSPFCSVQVCLTILCAHLVDVCMRVFLSRWKMFIIMFLIPTNFTILQGKDNDKTSC